MRAKIENKIDELEKLDIIEKVQGPTPWTSNLVCIPKKDNDIRLCLDLRQANKAVQRERFPMPNIEDTLEQMNNSSVFSRLDLKQSFHQIELEESSRYITTFVCSKGLYRYKRLLFGVNSAPEMHQRIIQQLLQDIPNCRNIADDIIIHTDTIDSHKKVLTQVLTRLREKNLTLNKDKCEFFKTELKFMGHTLCKDGIKIDESKVQAVRDAKPPQNVSEILSFLGLVTFCAKFIPNYATIAEPLRKLTRKGTPWEWSDKQQTSFDRLKQCLISAEVMAYYNPNAETQVVTDASPWGLGSILNQKQTNGDFRPVAYASRTLTETESRYSKTEKEALGVLFGIQKFHVYLWGMTNFDCIVDHKPLERIFTAKHEATPRIQNWVLKLQPYSFTVRYQPGHMMAADILSRKPLTETDNETCTQTENYINFLTKTDLPIAVTLEELKQASEEDDILTKVRMCLETDRWQNRKGKLWPYFQVRDSLSVKDSLLLKGNKLVIPDKLQQRILASAHESHMGIVKTKRLIREKVWFPNIDRLVDSMIKTCHACQMTSTPPQEPPVSPTDLPTGPWKELAIDITGPFGNNEYLLVLIDYYTRYPLVEIIKSTTSKSIINQLSKWFAMFGLPLQIKSDNAPNFVSEEFKLYLQEHGITHSRATPYFPRSNGLVENFNKSLKKCVRAAVSQNKNWRTEIDKFLLHFRATEHSTTGKSPAELLFSRSLKTKLPQVEQTTVDKTLRQKDKTQKQKNKFYADRRKASSYKRFTVGQPVLILQRDVNKMGQIWDQTIYKVISQKGTSLKLKSDAGNIRYRNVSHVRPYFSRQQVFVKPAVPKTNTRILRRHIRPPVRYKDFV